MHGWVGSAEWGENTRSRRRFGLIAGVTISIDKYTAKGRHILAAHEQTDT